MLATTDRPNVLVLGDLILDRYTWGDTKRVSPEAPVLVLQADKEEVRLGGAASVALLSRGLDAEVTVAGVRGDDADGRILRKLFDEAAIDQGLVLCDPRRPTTTKERFVGRAATRHPHQILRVDREVRDPLSPELEQQLAEAIVSRLGECQALLISDYNKGVCTPQLLRTAIEAASEIGMPVVIDPARITDYMRYRGATILTPNRIEAELAAGRMIPMPNDALVAGHKLCEQCRTEAVLVTLDSQGMALMRADETGELLSTTPRSVYDITGAGDMVLAMVGLCQAVGMSLSESARLANLAAGLEVEKLGVAPVSRLEIQAELIRTEQRELQKLVTLEEMVALAESYRRAGRTIVFTNGCFDLLHVGHVTYLQEAAGLGDVSIVAVNSDRTVRKLKTADRPVINQKDRAALVAALDCVDHVLIFDEDTPHQLLRLIRPDVLVKGGTYTTREVVGSEVVQAYGGKVCVTGRINGVSTTQILSSVRSGEPRTYAPTALGSRNG